MGAGASVPDKIDEATCKTLAGDKFDQAKFDELKDADGAITKEQLMGLAPAEEAAAAPAEEEAAAAPAEEEAAAPAAAAAPVTIPLKELPDAVKAAQEAGLTPLVIDSSDDHKVDTFYSYGSGVVVMDAKMIGLKVAKKEATQEESLDEARKKLVFAMKKGHSLIISMQQASPPFSDWLDNADTFPATEVFTKAGKGLAGDAGQAVADKIFKPEDTADTAGMAFSNEDFNVVLTTFFDAESYAEFLFDEGMGLSKFGPSLFQPIIIAAEE